MSNYCLKICVFEANRLVSAKFSHIRGRPLRKFFALIDRPVIALQLCRWQYSQQQTL